ncbi:MAG: carbohydrate kinase family protein [Chloroflexota bacterium]
MPGPAYDILVAGEINPDLILSGNVEPEFGQVEKLVDDAVLTIGSSSAIFACGAARLGLRVAFIGHCGQDVFGRYMLEALQQRGVDTRHVIVRPDAATGFSVILNRGADRAILSYAGLMAALRPEDLPDDLLRRARHLHVASYFIQTALQPGLPQVFRRAHALGLSTSLDTNYDPAEAWRGLDELLTETDIFLPNAAEAAALAGTPDPAQAARRLSERVGTLAVKLGAQGALGVQRSPLAGQGAGAEGVEGAASAAAAGQVLQAASLDVAVVDTVGAGDSFDAGFVYACLNGWPLARALRLGTVCGALSTRQAGGTAAQPGLDEALDHL